MDRLKLIKNIINNVVNLDLLIEYDILSKWFFLNDEYDLKGKDLT
jgi:hypothetical protein